MEMEIEGTKFSTYDKRYLQIIRQLAPQTVKPNVWKSLKPDVAMAFVMTDTIALSPEAQKILKKLREKWSLAQESLGEMISDEEFIINLKKLRDLITGKGKRKKETKKSEEPAHQIILPVGEKAKEKDKTALSYTPLRDKLSKMIIYAPVRQVKNLLIAELEPLGENIVEVCKQFGVKIVILDRNKVISDIQIAGMQLVGPGEKTFDHRDWDKVRGLYDQDRRLIVIGEEQIGYESRSPARHEFAHAFDHTFTVKNKRRLPLSVQLWNLFGEERTDLISEYAGTQPAEYFAECVENFFIKVKVQKLRETDPKMYEYLETLFSATAPVNL